MAAYLTGWTALRGHAVGGSCWRDCRWAGLPSRLLDVRESRLAAVALDASLVAYLPPRCSYLGSPAIADPRTRVDGHVGRHASGPLDVAVGVVSYARFVVLDAQGLIAVRRRERAGHNRRISKIGDTQRIEPESTSACATPAARHPPLRS